MKREFILAMSIFVTMAIVGTAFGLFYVSQFGPARTTVTVDPKR